MAISRAVLNVCFPYTSRDEITTAVRETVVEYSRPLPEASRPFSEARIRNTIRSRQVPSTAPDHPLPSTSDVEDSASSSSTLYPESSPIDGSSTPKPRSFRDPENVTAATIDEHLYTAGNPPLDLLVRTSGVERLSDFMLWQCHQQTDVFFLDCLWPEFDLWHFLPVLLEWQWRRKTSQRVNAMRSGSTVDLVRKNR